MKKLRVAVLMLKDFVPPESLEGLSDEEIAPWKTEYDVLAALEELGHDAEPLAVDNELSAVRAALAETKPHIVFNLLEEFHGIGSYVPYVLGYFELIRQSYTGCNPYGMMLTHNKAVAKKILRYHRIPSPPFVSYPRGRAIKPSSRLPYPLIVKSATEHGSVGIAQASIVNDDQQLKDRVTYVHEQLETDAIAETYVEGRELYVGVIGNRRLKTFPVWELPFDGLPKSAPRIATEKTKWDLDYQVKRKIQTGPASDLPDELVNRITRICKRAYRLLGQTGYARMDLRLTEEGGVHLLESNPNPQLEYGEDFAESAEAAGVGYNELIQRILNLGQRAHADRTA
ncbi:MAG: ATP-grasp domain-containing protein [Phycisphaerae bacterium]|jgi:D-alanine-D-alanine ligase